MTEVLPTRGLTRLFQEMLALSQVLPGLAGAPPRDETLLQSEARIRAEEAATEELFDNMPV